MTPLSQELVEAAEHLVHDGHLPHSEAHLEDEAEEAHEGDEHGCTPVQHRCGCCASMPGILDVPLHLDRPVGLTDAPLQIELAPRTWSTRSQAPPTRPPIV